MLNHLWAFLLATVAFSTAFEENKSYQELVKQGVTHYEAFETNMAVEFFTRAIELEPKNWVGYYHRAKAFSRQLEHEKALADFGKALDLDPKQPALYALRGEFLYNQGRREEALRDLNRALKLDPKNEGAYSGLVLAFKESGEYRKAISLLEQEIKVLPNRPPTYSSLALIYASCPAKEFRDGQKALRYAKIGCEKSTGKDYAYYSLFVLAAAYAELGQFDIAIRYQKEGIRMTPPVRSVQKLMQERLTCFERNQPFREKRSEKQETKGDAAR